MRKFAVFCLIWAALAGLVTPPPAGATTTLLDSQTTTASSTPITIMTATGVFVQVRSASGSVATVIIETSLDQSNWTTVATINNPTSSGEIWSGPGGGYLRVTIPAYTSGAITVKAAAVRGPDTLF